MLLRRPTKANSDAIANWDSTNRLTVDIFNAYWLKVSAHLSMPGSMAGDGASYCDWDGRVDGIACKHFGTRRADGAKHGVIRSVTSKSGNIEEATWYENKRHGLSFFWGEFINYTAFVAKIFEHGKQKAHIWWNKDWSE